ncbi:MAG: fluoride efflux transporter CrcB [Prevotellaceae bacterium]|nr:fluoride efflux transporter CrcB [Prevotellaceae bacterium]
MKQILLVGLGGGVGSILRYLTSFFIFKKYSTAFPWGTFVVNILGCLIIGFLIGLSEKSDILDKDLRLLLVTGFCGGYTTFSAFSAENFQLFETGNYILLTTYIAASVIIGILATWSGYILAKI